MALESMNVKIGADLTDLLAGMQKAGKTVGDFKDQLGRFKKELDNSTDGQSILRLNKAIEASEAKIKALTSAGKESTKALSSLGEGAGKSMEGITAGSQNAKYAVLDLGHVFRDLPFALSNPAILSGPFDRAVQALTTLKQTTSETGQSMGALVKGALIGPGGILIAVELVTSALAIFGPEIITAFRGGANAVNELKENTKVLTEVQQQANKEAGKQIVDARILYETATNVNLAMADRIKAAQTLKEEFKQEFKNTTALTIVNGQAKASYDELTKSILDNARGLAARNKLGEIENQRLDIEFQKQKIRNANANEKANVTDSKLTDFTGRSITFTKEQQQKASDVRAQAALKDQDDKDKTLKRQADFLIKFAGGEGKIADAINDDTNFSKTPKAKAHIKDVDDVLKSLNEEIALNQKLADIGFVSSEEQDLAKIAKVKGAIEEILKLKNGPGVNSSIVANLITSIQPEEARTQLSEKLKESIKGLKTVSQKELFAASDAIVVKLPVNLKIIDIEPAKALAEYNKELAKTAAIADLISPAFENAFASIANGQNVFSSLTDSLKQIVIQLAEAAIKAAVFSFILNAVTGGTAGASGSFTSVFGSLLGFKVPGHADGGFGLPGGIKLVGERGPELVRLPQGSDVIPNHRLNEITGGGAQVVVLTPIIRGTDLLLLHDRATQQQNRRG